MKLKSYFNAIENLFTFFCISFATMVYIVYHATTNHPPNCKQKKTSFQYIGSEWEKIENKIIWRTSRNENIVSFWTTHARCYPFHKNWSSSTPTPGFNEYSIVSQRHKTKDLTRILIHAVCKTENNLSKDLFAYGWQTPISYLPQDERILSFSKYEIRTHPSSTSQWEWVFSEWNSVIKTDLFLWKRICWLGSRLVATAIKKDYADYIHMVALRDDVAPSYLKGWWMSNCAQFAFEFPRKNTSSVYLVRQWKKWQWILLIKLEQVKVINLPPRRWNVLLMWLFWWCPMNGWNKSNSLRNSYVLMRVLRETHLLSSPWNILTTMIHNHRSPIRCIHRSPFVPPRFSMKWPIFHLHLRWKIQKVHSRRWQDWSPQFPR